MRRILRKIAAGEEDSIGDTSTLADPSVRQGNEILGALKRVMINIDKRFTGREIYNLCHNFSCIRYDIMIQTILTSDLNNVPFFPSFRNQVVQRLIEKFKELSNGKK